MSEAQDRSGSARLSLFRRLVRNTILSKHTLPTPCPDCGEELDILHPQKGVYVVRCRSAACSECCTKYRYAPAEWKVLENSLQEDLVDEMWKTLTSKVERRYTS